jgi:trigger factor
MTQEELVAFASKTIKKYYSRYGIRNINEEEFSGIVKNMMADKEEVKRLNDRAYDQKILEYFKKAFKFNSIEISFDEYTSKMQEKKQ